MPTSISGNGLRRSIGTHKMQHKCVNNRLCCDVWKRPARKMINGGEDITDQLYQHEHGQT